MPAQHLLGLSYQEGQICEQDDFLALAWYREAIRNGSPAPYIEAGNLLTEGKSKVIQQDNMFGFVNFLGAYQFGAFFLKDKLQELQQKI